MEIRYSKFGTQIMLYKNRSLHALIRDMHAVTIISSATITYVNIILGHKIVRC